MVTLDGEMIVASGEVGLIEAEAVKSALLTLIGGRGDVVVDCTAVELADLCFVQIVVAAKRSLAEQNRSLRLVMPATGAVATTLIRSGFQLSDFS